MESLTECFQDKPLVNPLRGGRSFAISVLSQFQSIKKIPVLRTSPREKKIEFQERI
jgi:hypothetical protein